MRLLALFVLLVLSFAVWGIEDVVRNFGRDTAVARVGDQRIEAEEAQIATAKGKSGGSLLGKLGLTKKGVKQAA